MKMSDVFGLPLMLESSNQYGNVLFEGETCPIGEIVTPELASSVVKAVNHHDELVEALSDAVTEMQCLIGAHTQMIGGLDDDSPALVAYNKAKVALEKAK